MLAAIRNFFSDWFGGSGAADHDFGGGGGGGGRGFGGVRDFGGFSAEYGSGDFWMTGSHAPGASRELLAAEAAYEQRLQNTIDARDARNALQRGDTQTAVSILNRNPEVGVSVGGVELYGTTGAAFLQTQNEAARVAAQQGIDRTGQIRTNLNGQADSAPGPASAPSTGASSSVPGFDGGVINIPVGASDTQWDVVKRSLAAFAKKADLPVEEQANFVNYWTARLKADGETSLYNYTTSGRQKMTAEEFTDYQRRGNFPSYLTPDRQPVIVADLQRRLAEIEGEVVRISVNDAQQRATQHREGFGAFFDGVVRGDFSDNRSWSTTAGQIVGGLNPLADIRDIAAGVKQVAAGEEGGWLTLVTNVAGAIPVGGDAAKALIKAGRKVANDVAEEAAERAAKEAAQQATLQAMKAVPEDVVVDALKEGFTTRRMQFGEHTFQLDYPGMKHILQRHHPEYWDGSIKDKQSFLDPKMSITDVGDAVEAVMRQNRETLIERGTNRIYRVSGSYDGQDYVLGLNKGRIGMFYPQHE